MGEAEEPRDVFEIERIRQLVALMEQHDLGEVELRQGDQRIKLRRGAAPATVSFAPAPAAAPAPAPSAPSPSAPSAAAEAKPEEDGKNIHYITSPMVGTFYSKPNPEAPAFAKVGDRVSPETTVCIIEAMKVFNEINADCSGVVVAVLVESEEPVEFGKKLFKIDTSK